MAFKLQEVALRLNGTTPLLLHNVQLANPLNEWSKQISDLTSRKKAKSISEEEFASDKARLQFLGGLYWDDEIGVYMPGFNVFRSIMEGGTMSRLGTKIEQAVVEYTDKAKIEPWSDKYSDGDAIFADGHYLTTFVKIGTSTVLGTRPQFIEWAIDMTFSLDADVLHRDDFVACAEAAGRFKGLGDGRKKGYGKGRYTVEVLS